MHFQYQSSALIMRITLLFLLCISKSIFNCTNQSLLDDQIKNDNHLQSETKKKETLDFFEESENATDKVLLTHTSISRNITMNYKDIDCNYNLEGESSIFYNCQALVQVQSSPVQVEGLGLSFWSLLPTTTTTTTTTTNFSKFL